MRKRKSSVITKSVVVLATCGPAVALGVFGGSRLWPGHAPASANASLTRQATLPGEIVVGTPLGAPKMTLEEAVAAAEANAPSRFGHSPVETQFGSYAPQLSMRLPGSHSVPGGGTAPNTRPLSAMDVWVVHVAGLSIENPGGSQMPNSRPAPELHQAAIIVQDSTGRVLATELSP